MNVCVFGVGTEAKERLQKKLEEPIPAASTEGSFWESELILRASMQAAEVRLNYSRQHFTRCLPRPPPLGAHGLSLSWLILVSGD